MSTQPASSTSNSKPRTKSKDDGRPKVTRTRSKRSPSGSSCEEEDSADLKAKHNHSVIERRYRDNLNGKITHLHRILQAVEANSRLIGFEGQYSDPGRRVRKCDIMSKAIHYVHQSDVGLRHMTEEIQHLQEQVRGLEKLVKCEDCTLLQNLRSLQLELAY
jgi:polyhydroxyalkanoate synthesis regulator phasin